MIEELEELLFCKLALFKMLDQYGFIRDGFISDIGESCFEAAFTALGFEASEIPLEEFYRRYDIVQNDYWVTKFGFKYPTSHLDFYLKHLEDKK